MKSVTIEQEGSISTMGSDQLIIVVQKKHHDMLLERDLLKKKLKTTITFKY